MFRFAKRSEDIASGVPIVGMTGPNGSGKTLLACNSAIADMVAGREVFSTVPIVYDDGETVYRSQPIVSLRQLLELPKRSTLLLDDVASIFSSRSTQSVPPEVITLLHTLRHKEQRLIWTAPGWLRADTNIRLVTQAVVAVAPIFTKRLADTPWPQTTFGAAVLLDTKSGKTDANPDKVLRRRFVALRRLASFGCYDTHAPTPQIGGHVHTGSCPDCGGTRSRPKHSPELHEALGLPWYDDAPALAQSTAADRVSFTENHEGAE